MEKSIKVAWLCSYQLNFIRNELSLEKDDINYNVTTSWLTNLSENLASQNYIKLYIITFNSKIKKDKIVKKNHIDFYVLKYSFPFSNRGFPKYLPINKWMWYKCIRSKIEKYIKSIKPDILHAHGTEHVYSLVSAKSTIPSLVSIQGIINEISKIENTWDFQTIIENYSIKSNKYFGCRTAWDRNEVLKRNPKATIFYLPEAINIQYFINKWEYNGSLSLVFVGAITQRKGVEDLIQSVKFLKLKFPKIVLHLIGDGNIKYINKIKNYVHNDFLNNNIIFHGFMQTDKIIKIMMKCSIFVLPTYIDNSPNSLAEAMALGIPSISTNVGGVPSMINNGVDGFLVNPGNINTLCDKINDLLTNKDLQRKFSKNARNRAYKRNHPKIVTKKTIEVYKTIIKYES